jgi:hypothetical protein
MKPFTPRSFPVVGVVLLLLLSPCLLVSLPPCLATQGAEEQPLKAGFGSSDITPRIGGKPVYLAGFGHNRKATGVHDPLFARAVVLEHAGKKLALVSVDVVGLFYPTVERIRAKLPGYTHVLVSSTHNHEGPDTLGLWGPHSLAGGLDPEYLGRLEEGIVKAVRAAEATLVPVEARLGAARAPELLHDAREPQIKHDELTALEFRQPGQEARVGLVVQWNCHPETLGSKNTQVSADFVGYTVEALRKKHGCPVVYLTGTVGGLMTSLKVDVRDPQGKPLADGTFEKAERYGQLVADVAGKALAGAKPVRLTPCVVRVRPLYLPVDNLVFQAAWHLGVLDRPGYAWKGRTDEAAPLKRGQDAQRQAIRTEVGLLRLGELDIAAVPGEIYPELVLGKVQDPPDPGADFPDAPAEPGLYAQSGRRHKMLIGLANDEIGYIIPKRQWDEKAPFCYGRKSAQYGEINSLGPDTAPLLCRAFADLAAGR